MDRNIVAIYLVVGSIVIVILFQFINKILKLRGSHYESEQLLPLCQTLSELLECVPQSEKLTVLKTMENSHFRSIWVTVYNKEGEVWADSFQPAYGQLPMPASEVQRTTFGLIKHELTKQNSIKLSRFGTCLITKKNDNVSMAAVQTDEFIVCVQTCGCESC